MPAEEKKSRSDVGKEVIIMIDSGQILTAVLMLGGVLGGVMIGYPLAIVVGFIGVVAGVGAFGIIPTLELFYSRTYELLTNYTFLAIPMFVFMGSMLEHSGVAKGLYDALYEALGRLKGGLAIATVLIGTVLAAAVGILGASVTMLTLVALPSMLEKGYDKSLAAGSIMAGGTLGILIPPSVMLVVYGPLASLSVGKLLMGAFLPGFMLSGLYCAYIAIVCYIKPSRGPAISREQRLSTAQILKKLLVSLFPPAVLIMSVLGVIFLGIAPPTQAASVGAFASILIALAYGKLTWENFKDAAMQTVKISGMVMLVGTMCFSFVGVFIRVGGGEVISQFLLNAPIGRWGILGIVLLFTVFLGMVMEWIGVLFILVPIVTPIMAKFGFNPLWFALMMCITLQTSFLTPPVAPAIFYFQGAVDPKLGVNIGHAMKGVLPFIFLVLVGVALCSLFPNIILWLPSIMIGG